MYAWLIFFILVLLAYDNAFSVHTLIVYMYVYIHIFIYLYMYCILCILYIQIYICIYVCVCVYCVYMYLYILNTYHCVPWKNGNIVERRGRDASELRRAIVNRILTVPWCRVSSSLISSIKIRKSMKLFFEYLPLSTSRPLKIYCFDKK